MKRLMDVLEEFFVYTSAGKRLTDVQVAAGIALAELRRLKSFRLDEEEDEHYGSGERAA